MTVRVLYFGVLREFTGVTEESVEVEAGSPVSALLQILAERSPRLGGMSGSIAAAVNREYAGLGTVLADGDEVALLPPVSGGCCAG